MAAVTGTGSTLPPGAEFLERCVRKIEALPPAERPRDAARFLAAYRLIDAVVAALPAADDVSAPRPEPEAVDLALLRYLTASHLSMGSLYHPSPFVGHILKQLGPLVHLASAGCDSSGWSTYDAVFCPALLHLLERSEGGACEPSVRTLLRCLAAAGEVKGTPPACLVPPQ
ncbi:hypothetical protein ABPG75_005631 [Micractinium tetrahymenae]